jgi:hypothetical protein
MVVKVSCKNVIITFQLLTTQENIRHNGMVVKFSCMNDNTKKHNWFS